MRKIRLECGVCQNKLRDPRILDCGHTYCFKCIELYFTKARHCPKCKKDHSLSAEETPKNIEIGYLLADSLIEGSELRNSLNIDEIRNRLSPPIEEHKINNGENIILVPYEPLLDGPRLSTPSIKCCCLRQTIHLKISVYTTLVFLYLMLPFVRSYLEHCRTGSYGF